MNHTPGPWDIRSVPASGSYRIEREGRHIATAWRDRLIKGERVEGLPAENNARLIAAAPELLAALQAWVAGCGDEHFSTKEQCRELIESSGALIAKVLNGR